MNGVLLINKPKGITSRDVVNIISKKVGTNKVGHTGTLDPIATGVLVITIGSATKLTDILTASSKEYIAEITFGIETDSLDITGNILKTETTNISESEIINVFNNFPTVYDQEVPIFSAVKVNGKKLYQYARNNEKIALPKREVQINNLELIEFNNNIIKFKVTVSKGTYIRSLIRDICNNLQVIGTMSNLIRTKQGKYKLEDCYNIDDSYTLISIEEILSNFDTIELTGELEKKVFNGALIENVYSSDNIVFKKNNKVIAIYKSYEKNKKLMKPSKMFIK